MSRINELVERFKQEGNSAFGPIADHYRAACRNWHRRLSKSVKIDPDDFRSEFEELLYYSLIKFATGQVGEDGKVIPFDHYFAAALRRRLATMVREFWSQKNQSERKIEQLSLDKHDVIDQRSEKELEALEVADLIRSLPCTTNDRKLMSLKLKGFTIDEVCQSLAIRRREYWSRVANLRTMSHLVGVA
jgi:hypothetical protein